MFEANEGEAEEIKKKRLSQQQKLIEARRAEEQLKATLRLILEPDAYERLSNVRHANRELYLAASQYVIAAYKRFGQRIDTQNLLKILTMLKARSGKREPQIRFERK